MKKLLIPISILMASSLCFAEVPITKEWAYEHPLATQNLSRLNREEARVVRAYNGGSINKEQAESILGDIKKSETKLQEMINDRDGRDISDDQNIYMNGQSNLIYNKTRQYLADDQPDWDDKD